MLIDILKRIFLIVRMLFIVILIVLFPVLMLPYWILLGRNYIDDVFNLCDDFLKL